MNYYSETKEDVLNNLQSSENGLTATEASARLNQYGRNELQEGKKKNLLQKIWDQINDPMVLILIAASVISGALGETADMVIILLVVILNTVIGLLQESKAEQAVEALKKMSAQTAKVIRDGKTITIEAALLVPGDIVVLDAGDLVPADLRLLESSSLKIEEASLTGESVPSEKYAQNNVDADAPIGDRHNMAYYGTGVTYGRGKGVVTATGMTTEMGKIASMINESDDVQTPLQIKLAEIGKVLTIGVLGICVVIFATIILKARSFDTEHLLDAFMIAVSLAVAAIPEGLPAVVTIVMAMGVTKMAKRKAIVKKLPTVETLGCAQVICSDKTGTLTQNKMDVRELYIDGQNFTADSYLTSCTDPLASQILYLCNDSEIGDDGQEIGDPTETCLKRYVLNKFKASDFVEAIRITDLPFDSERKMMSTVNRVDGNALVFTKGAPDEILKICTHVLVNNERLPLNEEWKQNILNANHNMAGKALRVLGLAFKEYQEGEELEEALTFVGLTGMMDPPRPEAFEAIKKCKKAGIVTVMITGDHKDTAVAIAKELGIIEDDSQAVMGSVLDSMDDKELEKEVQRIRVYARVSPQHKVRIVQAWQRLGKVVGMTGDGVNDAPALKIADIGIGMGITGTDVSKGVSDMLLSDDNFATIVNAVEEGRKIYTNIRKAIQFLLSCNLSEVLTLFTATLILPPDVTFLGAVHILWINLVTDAIPAIGLGLNQGKEDVMKLPPREGNASIFADGVGFKIIYQGLLLSAITLGAYFIGAKSSAQIATTMAFVTLSTVQLFHSFNIKAGDGTALSMATFDNIVMHIGFYVPMILMLLIVNIPFLSNIFRVVPLSLNQWLISIGLAFAILPIDEIIRRIRK